MSFTTWKVTATHKCVDGSEDSVEFWLTDETAKLAYQDAMNTAMDIFEHIDNHVSVKLVISSRL